MKLYQDTLNYAKKINWSLLLFLLLVLNVKMVVKCAAVLILLVMNRKLFRDKAIYQQKYTWFYAGMIIIAVFNFLLSLSSFSLNYTIAVIVANAFWALCIAAAFLNYWFVKNTDKETLDRTLTLFFILNAIASIAQLVFIMWDAGSINPYTYQGEFQKYFINTGDRIKGISFDLSATNSFISAFGVIYFLYSEKIGKTILCMITLLLTVSNFTNIILLGILLLVFLFASNRVQKSLVSACLVLMVIFMVKVSPHNSYYIEDFFGKAVGNELRNHYIDYTLIPPKPDSLLTPDEKKKKFAKSYVDSIGSLQLKRIAGAVAVGETEKLAIPKPNIHSAPYWRKADTTELQKEMLVFIEEKIERLDSSEKSIKTRELPGKLIAFQQIINYFKQHPARIATGAGAGNFSSKLAFRTTGMRIYGGYPAKFTRINKEFLDNHLRLYLEYYSKDIELHSIIHNPNSVYAQVMSEYGLIGMGFFLVFYVFYFFKKAGRKNYGLPLLLMMLGAMATDYWFEHLSIVILFELMILVLVKQKNAGN